MDLLGVMRWAPRSRGFKPDPVPPQALVRALEAARFAPSGGNRQGWRVVVVRDAGTRLALRDLYLPQWRAYLRATGAAQLLGDPGGLDPARLRMVPRADDYAHPLQQGAPGPVRGGR